jgi:hypothetical protein
MRQTLRRWLLAGLVAGAIVPTLAQAFPWAWYRVGDDPVVLVEGTPRADSSDSQFLEYTVETGNYRISANVLGKYDPYLLWGVVATNLTTAPLAFTFGFSTAIMPITTANEVIGSFSGSGTDTAADGLSVIPNQLDTDGDGLSEIATYWLNGTTNAGVDVGLPYSDGAGGRPHSHTLGPDEDVKSGPLGTWTSLETIVGFSLSGRDNATLNGFLSIEPVPEPRALLLLGSGLVAAALAGMRRRRTRT